VAKLDEMGKKKNISGKKFTSCIGEKVEAPVAEIKPSESVSSSKEEDNGSSLSDVKPQQEEQKSQSAPPKTNQPKKMSKKAKSHNEPSGNSVEADLLELDNKISYHEEMIEYFKALKKTLLEKQQGKDVIV